MGKGANQQRPRMPGKPGTRGDASMRDEKQDKRLASRRDVMSSSRPSSAFSKDCENDWRWYAVSDQIVKDVASFPFGVKLGNYLDTGMPGIDQYAVPGVMTFFFKPTVGVSNSAASPLNIAAQRFYSDVRHKNSGHRNYDYPDLMLYILALDSLFTYHSMLKRLLGVMLAYSQTNMYQPRGLVTAMGIDYESISKNIPGLRSYINLFAHSLGALCMPNSFSYTARHEWLAGNYFVDSDTTKAQLYQYMPESLLMFQLDAQGAGSLVEIGIVDAASVNSNTGLFSKYLTFDDLVTLGETMLAAVINDEDFGVMSGDILKAYGSAGIHVAQAVSDDYLVLPGYSREVLSQIENMTITNGATVSVTQATGDFETWLVSLPKAIVDTAILGAGGTGVITDSGNTLRTAISDPLTEGRVLNMHHDHVNPEEVLVATRLISPLEDGANWGAPSKGSRTWFYQPSYLSCGSEVISHAFILLRANLSTTVDTYMNFAQFNIRTVEPFARINTDTTSATTTAALTRAEQLSVFDWHPFIYPVEVVTSGAGNNPTVVSVVRARGVLGDIDNYTVIDPRNLNEMHTAALLRMFWVGDFSM